MEKLGLYLNHAFDGVGRLAKVTYSGEDIPAIAYSYDRRCRLTQVVDAAGTSTITYNADNTPATENDYNGLQEYNGPFDGKQSNVNSCSRIAHCSENFRRLFQWLTAAERRRVKDFDDCFLDGTNAEVRWKNHSEQFRATYANVGKCLDIIEKQINLGQCTPRPPDCDNLPSFRKRYEELTDPGEFPAPTFGPEPMQDSRIPTAGLLIIAIVVTIIPADGVLGDIAAWGACAAN